MLNDLGDLPHQLLGRALLTRLPVDLETDLGVLDQTRLRCLGDWPHGRAVIKAFADTPGAPLFFHFALQVAPRHIQANGITIDMRHRLTGGNISAALADRDHQLDLVVKVLRQARIGHLTGLTVGDKHERIGGFQKKKWRFAATKPHFFCVFFVIAAHTINAVDRKQGRFIADRNSDGRRCGKNCIHKKSIAIEW